MKKFQYRTDKIKNLREFYGFSQKEIAEYLNLSTNGYSMKENGLRKFTLDEAKKLAELFGVSIEELFFNTTSNQNVHFNVS